MVHWLQHQPVPDRQKNAERRFNWQAIWLGKIKISAKGHILILGFQKMGDKPGTREVQSRLHPPADKIDRLVKG